MSIPVVLLPTSEGVGVYALGLGLKYALKRQGYGVEQFNPLAQTSLSPDQIEQYFLTGKIQDLLTHFLELYDQKIAASSANFVLIEGTFISDQLNRKWFNPYVEVFNAALIRAFNAHVVLIVRGDTRTLTKLEKHITLFAQALDSKRILGIVVTKLNAPVDEYGQSCFSLLDESPGEDQHQIQKTDIQSLTIFNTDKKATKLLGITSWQKKLAYPRMIDIQRFMNCDVLYIDQGDTRRVQQITMCSRTIDEVLKSMKPGVLIITSSDRTDVILAACLAAQRGMRIAGLLLTANYYLTDEKATFFESVAKDAHLTILTTHHKSVSTILSLAKIDYSDFPDDDQERLQLLQESISECLDIQPFINKLSANVIKKMSPPAFRHYLIYRARKNKKRIVLPEGNEPRTIEAAIYCQNQGIADCILLGEKTDINHVADLHGFSLPDAIEIIDPDSVCDHYIQSMCQLRQHKNLTEIEAKVWLENAVTLGTMMVQQGDADGLVSGAIHTTANTIRPALKLIRPKPGYSRISSVFFMCMEDEVLVYGDCAINPDPDAQTLADIAIQSAQTAKTFGIDPKVAMLSYSTGSSGQGASVDKVKQATRIVKDKQPELIIDGPIQYDAATVERIAHQKAPDSPVAGQANVLIFPDLVSGNATYKAVQQSAHVLSIGPILQGLAKPINDLSRGATVNDIIYTIAVTAIQAGSLHKTP